MSSERKEPKIYEIFNVNLDHKIIFILDRV